MRSETQIQLRDYIERILEEREKALRLTAETLGKRLDHLNALREEVVRDRATFVSREGFDALARRVDDIDRWKSRMVGVASVLLLIASILGALAVRLLTK